jgi:hypothetical protein
MAKKCNLIFTPIPKEEKNSIESGLNHDYGIG